MKKIPSSFLSQAFFTSCLCFTSILSSQAQDRTITANTSGIPVEIQQRNDDVQKIVERSEEAFQKGENFLKAGEYGQARRSYDRAIDLVLESGFDVRREARLSQQYYKLVEQINQRQGQLAKQLQAPAPLTAESRDEITDSQLAKQNPKSTGQPGDKNYAPSPLDEVSKLNLTEDEKNATDEEAKAAINAAKVDFGFKPNALVQSWINYYQGRGRATMETGLRRSGRYISKVRRIFKEEGVPQDLIWLGQVESAWLPQARSWAAAVGLWQFIPGTGARFGLSQDFYVDERSSFEKATRASARYLKFLANRYAGNWELAMAAYNSGEGNVDRAVARSGYADFWEIYQRGLLPNETRNYVPNILATIIIAKNPERYGFNVKADPSLAYDIVMVNNAVDLRLAAEACDTTYEYLTELNPELKRGLTPQGSLYGLRVPSGRGKQLQNWLARIPADKRNAWRLMTVQNGDSFGSVAKRFGVSEATISAINGGIVPNVGQRVILPLGSSGTRKVVNVALKGSMTSNVAPSAVGGGYTKVIVYTVKANETINDIAARYGSSAKDIAALNRLTASTALRAGQTLKVPTRGK